MNINNIKEIDINFLLQLYHQSFPCRPYNTNFPYKKIRYMLNKYIEYGILEIDEWGWVCEITCHFTSKGLKLMSKILEGK